MSQPLRPMLLIKRLWPGATAVSVLTLAAILLLAFSSGVLFADPSAALSEARQKLYDMVAGDISRSLAVENSETNDESILKLNNTFSGSAVYAMGANTNGQLGIGTSVDTNTPVLLSPDVFGGPIAPGANHSLVIDKDGNLWAAGDDGSGQFGDGSTNSSTMTLFQTAQTSIKSVAAGSNHSLVVTDDGKVMGAGQGSWGQLGTGESSDTDTFAPVDIPGAVKAVANGRNSFVITDFGELYVFGENLNGQLGTGRVSQEDTPVKNISSGVVDVAPGSTHTLVLMADGSVMAMGLNSYGQFGDGTTDSSSTPKVVIPSGVKSVAAGDIHSMFVMADGSLQGAGLSNYGQMGTGNTNVVYSILTKVADDVANVSAGSNHTLYVTRSGALMGMGNNLNGQLGTGDFSPRIIADTIATDGVANVMAGVNSSFFMRNTVTSLEITGLDRVYAGAAANFRCYTVWADGRRTDVTAEAIWTEDSSTASMELNSGILDTGATRAGEVIRVSALYFDKTATRDVTVVNTPPGGAVMYGGGYNAYSQLGLDTTVNQLNLTEVTTDRIISAAGGAGHSLYVREDGSVFSMGDNSAGQLGTGDTIPRTIPAPVVLASPAVAVGAGDHHSLIVLSDGSLYSMGRNSQGQLGDGTQINRVSPTLIWKEGVVEADGGAGHSVFLTADGAVWTMGRNVEGQLGTGSTDASTTPIKVYSSGANAISAGGNHTLFMVDFMDMWGMGDNSRGQLGMISSIINQLTPVYLAGNVAQLSTGAFHSAYISQTGNLYLSGANYSGQQGNGNLGTDVFGFTRLDLGDAVNDVYLGASFSIFRIGTRTYTDTSATDYTWYAAGDNSYGQFSNGTTTTSSIPIVLPYDQVKAVWPANSHVLLTRGLPGDIDGDVQFTLHDVVIALQIMAGTYDGRWIAPYADVNGDGRVGLPEAQYALRKAGGL